MMVTRIHTVAFSGIETILVDVQVHISNGKFVFNIVGLPDKAVAESRERIRAAIHSMGLCMPMDRITVNLSPADLNKEGCHYDLPIAVGILAHMGAISLPHIKSALVMGELSLDGSITGVPGILPAAITASQHNMSFICPQVNGSEARWAGETLTVLAPPHLLALVNHFKGRQVLCPPSLPKLHATPHAALDMRDIKGQPIAKRALEIAAAGGHNMLMSGPPGSGKSMLAARLPSILPALTSSQMLEVSMIASITGKLTNGQLQTQVPFRSPHHSCSMAAMVGGGRNALPGEITLAHQGVLFLDELPEFPRTVLESLRQPLEAGHITVARANAHITYPAHIQLIAAMNPCKCGFLGDTSRCCHRAPLCGKDYQSKLSGPFLDRIDIHVEVSAVTPGDFKHRQHEGESSADILTRVQQARHIQAIRYRNETCSTNSRADGHVLRNVCTLSHEAQTLLDQAFDRFKLSMRSYHRILRVARTIADLRQSETITAPDMAEALSFRDCSS